jgi:hypothetical protein
MAIVLTSAGKDILTNRVIGLGTEPKWLAIGSGAGTAAIGDTTLFTEYTNGTWANTPAYARLFAGGARSTTTVTNDTVGWVDTWTCAAAQTVTNAGSFDALTVGNLCVKGDFTGVVLANGDSIQVTIKLQFT